MRYEAPDSRDTLARSRNFDSLSSRLTIRSNTGGGGPSIDSNATVAPLPAWANAPLTVLVPAQPPRPHAIIIHAAATIRRGTVRRAVSAGMIVMQSLITSSDIVKTR